MKKLNLERRTRSSATFKTVTRVGRQRGFTLLEALIAFVVLAAGLLALFRYHATTVEGTGTAKVRAEAIALGEQKLEELRSYLEQEDLLAQVDGAGLEDYAGVDYAENFTRTWTVVDNGFERKEIAVTVSWTDSRGDPQRVDVSSLLLAVPPQLAASNFARVIAYKPTGDPYWPPANPLNDGTGYGGGKVTIKYKDEGSDNWYTEEEAAVLGITLVTTVYNLFFTGTIESIDGGLLVDVLLDGGPDGGNNERCEVDAEIGGVAVAFDPLYDDPATSETPEVFNTYHFAGQYGFGDNGLSYNGAWVDGADIPVEVKDPYLYSCVIEGIPAGDTWVGNITYVGEQGTATGADDEVCIPNEGTTELKFALNSPELMQLGIVLVDKKNLCKAFK